MPVSPETQKETPQIVEHDSNAEFVVDESLKSTGVAPVQKTFKSQVIDNSGQNIVQTPPTQVITVTPPSDDTTLAGQAKGDTTNSLTWFAAFWIRILKRAIHFGWRIIRKGGPNDS